MLSELLLLSGNDIPFLEAQISVHQPTVKEIAYIGEEAFFSGCEFLNFSKDILNTEDKINLENKTNFEVFMSIMKDRNIALQKNKINALMVLTLMFPEYEISINNKNIALKHKENLECHYIDNKNFESFKEILSQIFCLKQKENQGGASYNPQGTMAQRIAEKLKKGRDKVSEIKGEKQKIAILSRYVSILAVGQSKDINSLLQYTVYQLFDEFNRFELKEKYDTYFQAKLAGAKGLEEEIDNWMKDIHP